MAPSTSNSQQSPAHALLFVPAIKERFYKSAAQESEKLAGVVLDLEDSIAPASKTKARDCLLREAPALVTALGVQKCWIRINNRQTVDFAADIQLIAKLASSGIYPSVMYPKYESPDDLAEIRRAFQKSEQRIFVNIESFVAVERLESLITDDLCIHAAVVGAEDLSADLGVGRPPNFYSNPLFSYVAARVASRCQAQAPQRAQFWGNIWPFDLGGATSEAFDHELHSDHNLGAVGKLVYHTNQIDRVNKAFSLHSEDIDDLCKRLEKLFTAYTQNGSLVTIHRSKMIDAPELVRAHRLLALRFDSRLKALLEQLESTAL